MSKKKIKEIFIGSNNKGKLKEIADLLPKSLKIHSNLDLKIPQIIDEDIFPVPINPKIINDAE